MTGLEIIAVPELQDLDESLEAAVEDLERGLFADEGLRPWSPEKLREFMATSVQRMELARSELAGRILLADCGGDS